MKREILFRGKRIDNGEWVEGYYWNNEIGNCFIKVIKEKELFVHNPTTNDYEITPSTVGQFTGLKDINGKKIFEGDIVTGLFNYTDIIGHIVYGSDATFFIERKGLYGIGLNNAEDWLEVIGNIHDKEECNETD